MKRIVRMRKTLILLTVISVILFNVGTAMSAEKVTFVDFSWDSVQIHNRIAAFIMEHGYGYEPDFVFTQSAPGLLGLERGNIHVAMELWVMSYLDWWNRAVEEEGKVLDLGDTFPKGLGGWYVPTYIIKGDKERGIEAVAPDLRSVFDLPEYWELFIHKENPKKGRFYNGPTGWSTSHINTIRFKTYGLDEYFDIFPTGSDTALQTAIMTAYKRGKPILAYYWEPTWVMGSIDMTLLDEPPHDPSRWGEGKDYGCGFPERKIRIGVNAKWAETHPDLVEFLKKYETSMEQNNEFLAHMKATKASIDETAMKFLRDNTEQWKSWVDPEIAEKVQAALDQVK